MIRDGRPPEALLKLFREWYLNELTTNAERGYFWVHVAKLDMLLTRDGHQRKPMQREQPKMREEQQG